MGYHWGIALIKCYECDRVSFPDDLFGNGIDAGGGQTVGITTSGAAYAWGENGYGQLGDGTITDRTTPVLVSPHP